MIFVDEFSESFLEESVNYLEDIYSCKIDVFNDKLVLITDWLSGSDLMNIMNYLSNHYEFYLSSINSDDDSLVIIFYKS